jgi:hypothetical protein
LRQTNDTFEVIVAISVASDSAIIDLLSSAIFMARITIWLTPVGHDAW